MLSQVVISINGQARIPARKNANPRRQEGKLQQVSLFLVAMKIVVHSRSLTNTVHCHFNDNQRAQVPALQCILPELTRTFWGGRARSSIA